MEVHVYKHTSGRISVCMMQHKYYNLGSTCFMEILEDGTERNYEVSDHLFSSSEKKMLHEARDLARASYVMTS